jgi:hypothetical protein
VNFGTPSILYCWRFISALWHSLHGCLMLGLGYRTPGLSAPGLSSQGSAFQPHWRCVAAHGLDWCLGLAFVAAMVALHYCDLTPVKPYRRFYDGVQTGMTQSEVVSLLHRTFPDGGRFRAPAPGVTRADCISFALENLDNHDHARLIILSLREGKVASKAYVPGAMY